MIGGRDQGRVMYPASYCPCESFNSSVHGAVLKYGFKHEMIQFTCSKIEGLGCLLLDVFVCISFFFFFINS